MALPNLQDRRYNVDRVRADFPILGLRMDGRPIAYLDSAASAQKPKRVLDAMQDLAFSGYANVHRGSHRLGARATDRFEAARERVRSFLNARSSDEIIFTKSATEAINLVAHSFGAANLGSGDEILLSAMEHHANIIPWHMLRDRLGCVLRWVDVDADGQLDPERVREALTPRTKLVAITHMSNVLGVATPLGDIVRLAHAAGVPVLADGAQAAVHQRVDVRALDVDFYAITGHKLYGPTGIGVLYGKEAWLRRLPPFLGGGDMVETVDRDHVTYAGPPHRFEAGTPPILEAVGLAAALDHIDSIGIAEIGRHEAALGAYARKRLSDIEGLILLGDADRPGPIVTFASHNAHAHDLAAILDTLNVCVRAGAHCAQPLLASLGLTSTCRASFAMYTSFEEVDRLVDGLQTARTMLR